MSARITTADGGVHAHAVTVRIGEVPIVDAVSVDVEPGGWLALLGPNGAGKTTFLRAVAGLVRRDGGTVRIGTGPGLDPATAGRRATAQQVAFVDQRPVLPPGMSVADYVLLGRTPHISALRMESAEDLDTVDDAMRRLDVSRFADRDVLTLSGGEAQRVVLARAIAQRSPVLILDEPTSALDLAHQQHVLELVDELRRERALTVLSSLHDLSVASQFARSFLLLACGQVVASGTRDEVLDAELLGRTFGAPVRVLDDGEGGIVVVPLRSPSAARSHGGTG